MIDSNLKKYIPIPNNLLKYITIDSHIYFFRKSNNSKFGGNGIVIDNKDTYLQYKNSLSNSCSLYYNEIDRIYIKADPISIVLYDHIIELKKDNKYLKFILYILLSSIIFLYLIEVLFI